MTRTAPSKTASPPHRPAPTASADDLPQDLVDRSIQQQSNALVAFRRHIHADPEASGSELKTTALVAGALRDAGLQPKIMRDKIGLAVDVDLGAPRGSFIALRAELDCVKVNDDKRVPYASANPGLCHACGHDAHTTVVLAATLAIHDHRIRLGALGLKHNFRAVFQPAEETATGALSMISQGALENVQAILAVHVEPFIQAGLIGLRKGPLTSACKSFHIVIHGRSGHSARPYQALDPIPAALNIVDLFYQLGPRSMDSRYPLALTVASMHAGSSFNAIPDQATISGTLRTSRLEDLQAVQKKMEDVIKGVAQATGCSITMDFPQYAPATNNDGRLIDIMAAAATSLLGKDGVQWLDVPSLGAEDFAFYQEKIPGAIVRLGAAMPDPAQRRPLHSSLFDIDESALTIGAKFLARSALLAASNFTANPV
ncbi:MAG: amidohydrolase [Phycisphaerales bacterium]|nr:amidohydrolase [Phycisphaerales bacterium]